MLKRWFSPTRYVSYVGSLDHQSGVSCDLVMAFHTLPDDPSPMPTRRITIFILSVLMI